MRKKPAFFMPLYLLRASLFGYFDSFQTDSRRVERCSFCNYHENNVKECVKDRCIDFKYDWKECPERKLRVNGCDCALRTETEAGIAISVTDLDHKLPYLIEDDQKVLLILEKGRFWQAFWRQASYTQKALNVKIPNVTIKDMQQYLVDKGYLMYNPLAEDKKEQYYTKWSKATLAKIKFNCVTVKNVGETEVFIMYVPKRLIPNTFTDEGFYLGFNNYEFKMPFEDIAKRHVNCVLS